MNNMYNPNHHRECPEYAEFFVPEARLAVAYIPYQSYRCFFPLAVGFDKGTIFEELYRPYVPKEY